MKLQNDLLRRLWAKYALLAALVIAGGAVGTYLSGSWPGGKTPDTSADTAGGAPHRFPLTAADVRDTMEAASLAADADGRVYLAWASQTGPEERTLWLARTEEAGVPFSEPRAITTSGIFRTVS